MLRYVFYRGWYLPWNGTMFDLDLNFKGKTFQVAILTSKRLKIKHYYCHQIVSQVFAIGWRHCECCILYLVYLVYLVFYHKMLYLDLYFQGHKFWNMNISKTGACQQKMLKYELQRLIFFIKWDHCECSAPSPWPKFERQIFQVVILTSKRENAIIR